MSLTFEGFTISGGGTPLYGSTESSRGSIGDVDFFIEEQSGLGVSFDPFSLTISGEGCDDCTPQEGDWITAYTFTILFVSITRFRWSLCDGRCRGQKTEVGFALGLEGKRITWVVQ